MTEFLGRESNDFVEKVPTLSMVDSKNVLQAVIVDGKLIREARRCADVWRSLRELGGIRNSHAERVLAKERAAWAEQLQREQEACDQARVENSAATVIMAPTTAVEPAEAEPKGSSDEPYIETPRCTSCDECTHINNKMFAYDANKQAYIADPDAGTYRHLVEAAESCQVAIIHPGKPRNPNEPGLEELMKRAETFL
ncbi:MAG: ferredoxin [Rhodomicrobium sp.]